LKPTPTSIVATLLFALAVPTSAQQETPAAPPRLPFPEALPDAHWSPIQQLMLGLDRPMIGLATRAPGGIAPYLGWEEWSKQLLRRLGLAFYDRYPADPRRWQWLAVALRYQPVYLKAAIDPVAGYAEKDETVLLTSSFGYAIPDSEVDVASRDLWKERQAELVAAAMAAADCPDVTKAEIGLWDLWWAYAHPRMPDAPTAQDVERWAQERYPLTQRFLELMKEHPDYAPPGIGLKGLTAMMIDDVRKHRPDDFRAFLGALRSSPNAIVARFSGGDEELERLKTEPIQMKFTTVDGREIDLAQMRGKVVLVDYWGTWCDKCHIELPWFKELHARYQADGFEIISVMMEPNGEESDRKRALADIKRNGLESWIHLVTTFNDPCVVKYGITAAPTHLLLDKKGCLIEKSYGTWHPTKLEPILRKALGK
jgi:thiol-disulfide isomerase/thioredoxin